MKITNQPIPKNKIKQFHEILVATGGRYTANPRECGDEIRVDYEPGDYLAHQEAWSRACAEIVEVPPRASFWRRILRLGHNNYSQER